MEEVVQSVSAFDDFEDRDEEDLESDEDFLRKLFQLKKFLLKDFPQFLSIPDAKRDPGNMPKEWRRFHKDSWVFNP